MESKEKTKKHSKRYYRKRVELFRLIDKIKLWPSRTGILHGIKTIEIIPGTAVRSAGSEINGLKGRAEPAGCRPGS